MRSVRQSAPWHDPLHLRQQLLAIDLLLGRRLLVAREAEVPAADQSSPDLRSQNHSS
jgi:hypothetical protein